MPREVRYIFCCVKDADTRRVRRNIGGGHGRLTNSKRCRCAKQTLMVIVYLAMQAMVVLCAAAIGYIVARDGSPFERTDNDKRATAADGVKDVQNGNKLPPPPDNLHEICSYWITEAGRQKCKTECDVGLHCALPASDRQSY